MVLPDPDSSRISHQQIYLLDLADGKKVAVPIVIRYRESSSSVPTPTPRARASSSVACLTIREEDELHLLFPNELILLASSTVESVRWREYIAIAKSRFDEIPLPLQRNKATIFSVLYVLGNSNADVGRTCSNSIPWRISHFCPHLQQLSVSREPI